MRTFFEIPILSPYMSIITKKECLKRQSRSKRERVTAPSCGDRHDLHTCWTVWDVTMVVTVPPCCTTTPCGWPVYTCCPCK